MAVKIRLQRRGAKKRPFYAVVAADVTMPRDGRFLEKLGTYDPLLKDAGAIRIDQDRVKHWIRVGAKPTKTVAALIRKSAAVAQERTEVSV